MKNHVWSLYCIVERNLYRYVNVMYRGSAAFYWAATWEHVPSDTCNRDLTQPALPRNLVILHMKKLCVLDYQKKSTLKILIRLRECTGLSESSLSAHVRRLYVFWRYGSIFFFMPFNTYPMHWGGYSLGLRSEVQSDSKCFVLCPHT